MKAKGRENGRKEKSMAHTKSNAKEKKAMAEGREPW
jgi:hypothetical protein